MGERRQKFVLTPVSITPITLLAQLGLDLPLRLLRPVELLSLALQSRSGSGELALGTLKRATQAPDIIL
jgi:hypothetical protein